MHEDIQIDWSLVNKLIAVRRITRDYPKINGKAFRNLVEAEMPNIATLMRDFHDAINAAREIEANRIKTKICMNENSEIGLRGFCPVRTWGKLMYASRVAGFTESGEMGFRPGTQKASCESRAYNESKTEFIQKRY